MMIQPTAQSIPAFDAKNSALFTFNVVGGNQVVSNRLVIRNNDTGEIVYNQKIQSYRFEHLLPENTLSNGISYNFYFQTYDIKDEESPMSNTILFTCYDTPTLEITNIPMNGIINTNNFTLNISYTQNQGELLDVSKVILFDDLGSKIFESKNLYNVGKPPIEFTYNLQGLDYDKTYSVQIIGTTVNNTNIQSEKYSFTVRYSSSNINSLLEVKNNCQEGCVELKNNFIIVNTEQNPFDMVNDKNYLNNSRVYLTNKDTYIEYIDGFNIADNFTAKFIVENLQMGRLITFSNYKNKIEINLVNIDNIYYLELKAFSNDDFKNAYILYSEALNSLDRVFIWIKKKDGLFELLIKEEEAEIKPDIFSWNQTKTGIYYDTKTNIYWR